VLLTPIHTNVCYFTMPQTPPQSDEEDDAKYYCPSCRCASCKAIAAIYEKCPNCSRRCCADKDGEYVEGGESEKQRRATGLLPPTPLARTKSMTGTSITQKNKAVLAARTAMNRTPKGPAVCLLSLEDDFVETCHVVRKALPSEMVRLYFSVASCALTWTPLVAR
jgi:hypothetical protein